MTSALSNEQIEHAAEQLYQAEVTRRQIPALTLSSPDMTMTDAYAIQQAWVGKKIAQGRTIRGYKIGLTSRAMQMAVNINEPDFGVLLDDMFFANGCEICAADFLDPRVEVELGFVLKKRLFGESVSIAEVLDATDYIVPAIELIAARCHRVDPATGYTRTVLDTISDNAANAGVIVGNTKIAPDKPELEWVGALLRLNDTIEETGLAAGVLGHPANGISWVCRRFAPHGVALEPGQFILSGSFTRPVDVKSGDKIVADYGRFGSIGIDFI